MGLILDGTEEASLGADVWELQARHTDFSGWRLRVRFARTTRGVELTRLEVAPHDDKHPPHGGIPTRLLRAVSVPDLVALVRHRAMLLTTDEDSAAKADPWSVSKRPGRRGRDDLHYARWAAAYVAKVGESRPVAELARAHHLSDSQVRNLLHEARRRDLLTRSAPGKAGGTLTPKAELLLREADGQ